MKKTYVKPQVYFEDFQLSASIAATCPVVNQNHGSGECGVPFGPDIYFWGDIGGCKKKVDNDGDMNICYYSPVENRKLFNSL